MKGHFFWLTILSLWPPLLFLAFFTGGFAFEPWWKWLFFGFAFVVLAGLWIQAIMEYRENRRWRR